jgi:sigma-B regulation protein RsbU (phosphoserine phosphatase)
VLENPSQSELQNLKKELQDLHETESEFFDFLDGLAHLVSEEKHVLGRLPRLVAEGVLRVVDASSAAVYLLDATGTQLVPHHVSPGFPPLQPLPAALRLVATFLDPAVASFAQATGQAATAGILGKVVRTQTAVLLQRLAEGVDTPLDLTPQQLAVPLMAAPLSYGTRMLGVLVVALEPYAEPFEAHHFEVFRGIAKQSGFALGSALTQEQALEKRRLEQEIMDATEVQRVLLPDPASQPQLTGYRMAGQNAPARFVSGDYYDFIPLAGNRLAVVIADVSGKGFPASLVMATCRGLLRGHATCTPELPSRTLAHVNRLIYPNMRENMFISMAYVELSADTDEITLCRAGHDAPILWRKATGALEILETPGIPVGVDEGDVFERVTQDHPLKMAPGDCLLLYTDGVNEAENAAEEQFGLERLHTVFSAAAPQGAHAVRAAILQAVAAHVAGHLQSDDITVVVVERV